MEKNISLYDSEENYLLVVDTLTDEGNISETVSYLITDDGKIEIIENAEHSEDEKKIFESAIYSAMENVLVVETESENGHPTKEEKKELYELVEKKVLNSEY